VPRIGVVGFVAAAFGGPTAGVRPAITRGPHKSLVAIAATRVESAGVVFANMGNLEIQKEN
jgi:hypothetical protein